MRTATKLSGIELDDWSGEPVRLETLWKERPVVLVFIRHFG
jgi:cytochrome oxidase Cu insertion factor (SCO1/SenC/PrrC family)